MVIAEETSLLVDVNQRLKKLDVERAKAQRDKDHERVAELQTDIDELIEYRERVFAAGAI